MSRVIPDPTWMCRVRLGRHRFLLLERTVYGPNSKTLALNLKGKRRVLTFMVRRFQVDGTDNP